MPIGSEPPFIQIDFSGGMNLFDQADKAAPDEYGLSFNVRSRKKSLFGVKEPLEDEDAPMGKKQGIFAFDRYLLLFCRGHAYYKDVNTSGWTQVADFAMDPDVNIYYTQAVPASTLNYKRRLAAESTVAGNAAESGMLLDPLSVNGTLGGLVVQDGINRPWIIFSDATAAQIQSYEEWTEDQREYVPVGKNMAFVNGILFVVSSNRKRLYRSVSGRPLDFVVNVTVSGNKGGNADTTAYSPSYSDITALFPLNSGELLVGTAFSCHPIEFNYDRLIFGEPTFLNRKTIFAGIVNQQSIIDKLGDYVFIDYDGLRSFNAVSQNTNEGRNSIFSARVQPLFEGIKQQEDFSCVAQFQDYLFFGAFTTRGFGNVVYDTTRERWQSFDRYGIGAIKQFGIATFDVNPRIFAITDTKVYELFAGTDYAESMLSTGAYSVDTAQGELKLLSARCVFSKSDSQVPVRVTEYTNDMRGATVHQTMPKHSLGIKYPVAYPVRFAGNFVSNLRFAFTGINNIGRKCFVTVKWANAAALDQVELDVEVKTSATSRKQQMQTYASPN